MTTTIAPDACALDTSTSITRSLLGWGILAGPIYLTTGLMLAITRNGFDLAKHPLSLLMLGDAGWMQRTNLVVSGLLCLAAAIGIHRAMGSVGAPSRTGRMVMVFGLGQLGSGAFAPDPMHAFPPGMAEAVTLSGILHMVFGLIQFLSLTAAGLVFARWSSRRTDRRRSLHSRVLALTVLLGFVGGASLAQYSIGVALLWIAVIAGYTWIATTCLSLWELLPQPTFTRRTTRSAPLRRSLGSRRLLAAVLAPPLFLAVSFTQMPFNPGFDLTKHAFSYLSIGPTGPVQQANFVVMGILNMIAATALRSHVRGRLGVPAAIFLAVLGASQVVAGICTLDSSNGFPEGAPAGLPDSVSTHGNFHGLGFSLSMVSWVLLLLVLARRYATWSEWLGGWLHRRRRRAARHGRVPHD